LSSSWTVSWTDVGAAMYPPAMTRSPYGHIEQLPSGSWRAKVYAGKDPLTGRELRFRKTRKTEVEAQIELGKLLELARAGRQPDSDVTVAELLDAYLPVAGWDVSTEETNLGYIRRIISPRSGRRKSCTSRSTTWSREAGRSARTPRHIRSGTRLSGEQGKESSLGSSGCWVCHDRDYRSCVFSFNSDESGC